MVFEHFIYILFSSTANRYYVGYSADPWKRLEQHNTNPSDKYTGKFKDWQLKTVFGAPSKKEALVLERFIKAQKSRVFLTKLIEPDFVPDGKLAQLVRVPHLQV